MEEKKDYRKELFYEKKNGYDNMDAAARERHGGLLRGLQGLSERLPHRARGRDATPSGSPRREGFVEYMPGMSAQGRGQGLVQQPRQGPDAGRRGQKAPVRGRCRRRRARGRAEARPQADPALRGQRAGLLQDPLLRRHQEIPVDGHTSGAARRRGDEGRRGHRRRASAARRTTRSSSSATCCPTWPPTR